MTDFDSGYRAGYAAGKANTLMDSALAGELATLREQVSHWRTRAQNAESTLAVAPGRGAS